jgi:hypothetical protein
MPRISEHKRDLGRVIMLLVLQADASVARTAFAFQVAPHRSSSFRHVHVRLTQGCVERRIHGRLTTTSPSNTFRVRLGVHSATLAHASRITPRPAWSSLVNGGDKCDVVQDALVPAGWFYCGVGARRSWCRWPLRLTG